MNQMNNKHNAQIAMVGGPKAPPPLTYINYTKLASNRSEIHALLHQVYTLCGRAFSFASFDVVTQNLS